LQLLAASEYKLVAPGLESGYIHADAVLYAGGVTIFFFMGSISDLNCKVKNSNICLFFAGG
jgi:hypothetical protein